MTFYPVKIMDSSNPYEKPVYAFGVYVVNGPEMEYAYESNSAYDLGRKLGAVELIKKNTAFPVNYKPPFHADVHLSASYGKIMDYKVCEMSEQRKKEFIKGLRDALNGK